MNKEKIFKGGIAVLATLSLVLGAFQVFAEGIGGSVGATLRTAGLSASTTVRARVEARRIEKFGELENRAKDRAHQEIDRRAKGLNKLLDRIDEMKRVSSSTRDLLRTTVETEISSLSSLKTKIDSDDSTTTLRTDIRSITKSYRIFALVIPQGAILAMADRIHTIADTMTTVSGKLQVRITEAQGASHDVTVLTTALTDLNAKIADAKVQADVAVSLTSPLKPDNGDNTVFQANKKVLQDARTKLRAASVDLKAAREDIKIITKGLRAFVKAEATATTTASTTTP